MQVCVDVFGCCEMYKCSLVAFNTQARNKTKKERGKKKKKKEKEKKRLAATCQSLFCLGLTKGLANIILSTGTRLAYTKREWDMGFGTVIFKVHPFSFFKSLSHPISPVSKKGVNVLL